MTTKPKLVVDLTSVLSKAESYFSTRSNINGKRFTKVHAKKMSSILKKYIDDEEFDYEAIIADLNGGSEDSALVLIICSTCYFINNNSKSERAHMCSLITNLFLPKKTTAKKRSAKKASNRRTALNINWGIINKIRKREIDAVRNYLCAQVNQTIFSESDDLDFLRFVAIGKKVHFFYFVTQHKTHLYT